MTDLTSPCILKRRGSTRKCQQAGIWQVRALTKGAEPLQKGGLEEQKTWPSPAGGPALIRIVQGSGYWVPGWGRAEASFSNRVSEQSQIIQCLTEGSLNPSSNDSEVVPKPEVACITQRKRWCEGNGSLQRCTLRSWKIVKKMISMYSSLLNNVQTQIAYP